MPKSPNPDRVLASVCKKGHSLEDGYHQIHRRTSKRTGLTREFETVTCRVCALEKARARRAASGAPTRRPLVEPPTDPAILAYTAGLFDGEGSVMVIRRKAWSGAVRPTHAVQLSLASVDRVLVDWMHNHFGGHMNRARPATARTKEVFHWVCGHAQAELVLRAIRPYMQLKGDRADLALELRGTTQPHLGPRWGMGRGGTKTPITEEIYAHREAIRDKVKALNRRGPAPEGDHE